MSSTFFPVERAGVPLLLTVADVDLLVEALAVAASTNPKIAEHPRYARIGSALDAGVAEARDRHSARTSIAAVADQSLAEAIASRAWTVPAGQTAVYDPDALLDLGDGSWVRMENATAEHLIQHIDVSIGHSAADFAVCEAKRQFLSERREQLVTRDCTLGELEAAAG